ncbi:MAG: diacylglycerol/lipid kinase family protein [Gaiellales bacterium]
MSTSVGDRTAAAVALVALPLAVVAAAIGAVRNFRELVVAVVGAVLLVAAGWYAVSRRGPVRTVALLLMLLGVVLLVGGVVISDLSWLGLAVTVVLGALSAWAARVALHRRVGDLKLAATPGTPAAKAERPVLIMNPKSGGGKAEKHRLVEECEKRGIRPIVLSPGDDLLELAEAAVAGGADVIGMAGGDGSQALVATVAGRHGIPHVVVPAGTRNHFALDLGLDREDVVGALDAYGDCVEREIDLATVNGRVFVNNASLGLYARIVQSAEYRDAKIRTAAAMLPDLIGAGADRLDLRYADPSDTTHQSAEVILVSNDPYQLNELGGRGTRERIDLGVLGVVAIHVGGAADMERFLALNAIGQIRRFHGWREWSAPRFQVDSDGPVEIGIDGEAMVLDPPLVFESSARAVRVRLPARAPGVSPAARRLSSSTPAELWRVMLGQRPAA